MATAAQIMDFETQFDNCLKIALASLALPVMTYQSTESALIPRIEVKTQIGTAASNRGVIAAISGDKTTGWAYSATITIQAFTRRLENQDARPIIAQIRALMLPKNQSLANSGLAYLTITGLDETASSRSVFNSDGQKADVSTLIYQIDFAISPTYQSTIG